MTMHGGPQGEDDPTDGVLVERTLAGDRGAFEVLVRRHQGLVFRIVGGFLRNRADVEEVAQEAFLRAFQALAGFRTEAPFGPWVAQIATRASYDRLRRRRRTPEVSWDDLPPAERDAAGSMASGADPADRAAARDLAERALAGLAPKDRQVLILADAQGFAPAEIAQVMRCSSLAVRVRLHRARRAMRGAAERLLDPDRKTS
ncbi:MAG TPA: RNA polymerase sigma factor [Candidatus Methylomirabilis sp.]|jgi:RNA polymerase sigma-70 factor (ECF subfamily)